MSIARAYIVSPLLNRVTRLVERGPIQTSVRHRPDTLVPFSTASERREGARPQRYGTAKEPPPHLLGETPAGETGTATATAKTILNKERLRAKELSPTSSSQAESAARVYEDVSSSRLGNDAAAEKGSSSSIASSLDLPTPELATPQPSPKDTVLAMPAPAELAEHDKPPHLEAPPYVHHFDTWTLVRNLQGGGFTQAQSTTAMKAVRVLLADNMELARRGLVSKSNVENETYLFQAACSELKTEVQNSRKAEGDKEATQRAQLQHEVESLNQRTTSDLGKLKDELKGMFDDRKMAVRNEQRNMERKIQELNYKITVALNSDARTEVEAVRWVLTRRAASALAVGVVMVLATLNYSRYMTATQAKERKQFEESMRHHSPANTPSYVDPIVKGSSSVNPGEAPSGHELLASEGVSLS